MPPRLEPWTDEFISIPMAGRADSLNVGMAAAVLCFEAARQRRQRGTGGGAKARAEGPETRATGSG